MLVKNGYRAATRGGTGRSARETRRLQPASVAHRPLLNQYRAADFRLGRSPTRPSG